MSQNALKQILKDYFSKQPAVEVVYLYGSSSKNDIKNPNDIDLAILFQKHFANRYQSRLRYVSALQIRLQQKVDIQDMESCRVDFAYRVIQEGKVVYCRNEERRVRSETTILNTYFDLNPFLIEYYEVLRRQALKGDFYA